MEATAAAVEIKKDTVVVVEVKVEEKVVDDTMAEGTKRNTVVAAGVVAVNKSMEVIKAVTVVIRVAMVEVVNADMEVVEMNMVAVVVVVMAMVGVIMIPTAVVDKVVVRMKGAMVAVDVKSKGMVVGVRNRAMAEAVKTIQDMVEVDARMTLGMVEDKATEAATSLVAMDLEDDQAAVVVMAVISTQTKSCSTHSNTAIQKIQTCSPRPCRFSVTTNKT